MDKLWDISRQIGARRKRLGLSLSQLARRANTSPATLSRYENGWARFEVSTLRKLATALDCDLVVKLQPRPRWVEQPTAEHVVQQIGRLFWDQVLTTSHLEEHSSDRTRLFWQQALEREGMTCTRKFSREEAASSWRSSNR
jgi:transcriptional regulator with XRE-family HTH domain